LIRPLFRVLNQPVPKAFHINDSIVDAACQNYNPSTYSQRLVLIRAQDRGQEDDKDPTLGWHKCVGGGIDVHFIPGDHMSMLTKPNVSSLLEKLTIYLDHGGASLNVVSE